MVFHKTFKSHLRKALLVGMPRLALSVMLIPHLQVEAQSSQAAEDSYGLTVLADHSVAYYRLNESPATTTAKDRSGNGHTGTYESNPTLGVPGLITGANRAVNFTSGDVVIPDSPSLNFVDQPFTIEAWVKLNSPGPTNGRIFDKTIGPRAPSRARMANSAFSPLS